MSLVAQLAALESAAQAFNDAAVPVINAASAKLAAAPPSSQISVAIVAFRAMVNAINVEGPKIRQAINDTKAQLPPKAEVVNFGSPIALNAGRAAISGAGVRKAR
jgi:hypothetical protein